MQYQKLKINPSTSLRVDGERSRTIKNQKYISKFKNFGYVIAIFIMGFWTLGLMGCATAPYAPGPRPQTGIPGIYHRVQRGQTLWRISKMYNIDLDEIIKTNRISDVTNIEIGQLILIPHRQKQQYAPYSPAEDFIWPLKGRVIGGFGSTYNNTLNKGINIQPYSSSTVVASRSGRAVFCADNFRGYGKTIVIDHGDGFSTVYARNSEVFIRPGDNIQKGTVIARLNSSDKNNYLHFEIRKGNLAQNPYFYLSH